MSAADRCPVGAKVIYPTQTDAYKARTRINAALPKRARKIHRAYHCAWCNGWHLTKQRTA